MELLVDAGLSPMEALLTATKWRAEIIGLDKQLGTVEPNELADLVILRKDPLKDIHNTKEVEQVIRGGEIMDIGYHPGYGAPFRHPGPETKHLYNPIPELFDVNAPMAPQGSNAKLRILGRGFVRNSVVYLDEVSVETVWVSPTELSAVLNPSVTSRVGTSFITVRTPNPGGGVSQPVEFIIGFP